MRINKNELQSMINQIDDDLLEEAMGSYPSHNTGFLTRIIPAAASVILLISSIAVAVFKNGVFIEQESSIIEASRGVTEDTVYILEANDNYIMTMVQAIDESFSERNLSDSLIVESVHFKAEPTTMNLISGTIQLKDESTSQNITVNMVDVSITVSKKDATKTETFVSEIENLETNESFDIEMETVQENTDYTMTWDYFCEYAESFGLIAKAYFVSSDYVIIEGFVVLEEEDYIAEKDSTRGFYTAWTSNALQDYDNVNNAQLELERSFTHCMRFTDHTRTHIVSELLK